VEPSEAITALEVALRTLIASVLSDAWIEQGKLDVSALEARREEERKSRDGAVISDDLLAFAHLYELRRVINRNWDVFKLALGEKKRLDVYLDRLEDFRNAPSHSRSLLPFERDLLSGMVGEIRNKVTLFRTTQGPDMEYYPKIEQVTDSFGNSPSTGLESGPRLRLKAGDVVQFQCRGWDPQDRNLTWELRIGRSGLDGSVTTEAVGAEVTLTLVINERMVREHLLVEILMRSDGQYHRNGFYDELCDFYYAVDPPRE
jgi:hypothetical protein